MDHLIKTYLLQKSRVSIPGLGTIYVERSPARSDFVNKQILPPSYHYRFDKYFDAPAKDFFTFLAAGKHIEDYEAIRLYNEWALSLRNSIGNDQPATLEGIGVLKRDASGDVLFEPASTPVSFNVPVDAKRIVRSNVKHTVIVGDREVSREEITPYPFDDARKKKIPWWVFAIIIATLAIVGIILHYSRSDNPLPFGNHQTIQPR